jgi:hypothetical protein
VLFPLGNRVLIGPNAGYQWVDSTIIKAIGGNPPPSTQPQSAPPAATTPTKTIELPNTDYSTGGKLIQQTDATGAFREGAVFDSNGIMRHDEASRYDLGNGKQYIAGKYAFDFDFKGHLQMSWKIDYDIGGSPTSTDVTHYGLHGERTWEETTDFKPGGYQIRDWSIGTHNWSSLSTDYKFPTAPGSTTPAPVPYSSTNTNIGVLFPRDFHAGDTITGSLWPSSYADNFKSVPGLSEYDIPIQLHHLPDGSPSWSGLEIGIPGDGYVPVRTDGSFSVYIPLKWTGPLRLNVLETDPIAGLGPTTGTFSIGDPLPAPTLPGSYFSTPAGDKLDLWTKYHLIDLWDDADDLEDELDYEYSFSQPDWDYIDYLEDALDDVYDEIDYIHFGFSPTAVLRLAQGYLTDTTNYNSWLSNLQNSTTDEQADLKTSIHLTNFLKNEIDISNFRSGWGPSNPVLNPYSTNPILTQGKLNVLRGSFFGDPLDTHFRIDNFPITPIAATPYDWYFMPPPGLTFGLHNEYIDSPLFGETVLPVFVMTLTMGAGQLQLHKGQSTTYFARLDIANGLPSTSSLLGGSPSYDTDLIGPSELAPIQQAAPASRTGFISFSVTNESPGTIAMQNQFKILDASNFVPSGSYQINGGITAAMDGGFSILGVARANLAPEGGIGSTPGASSTPGSSAMSGWLPTFSLNFDPDTLNKSPFMTNCSALVSGTPNLPGCPSQALIDLYNDATNPPTTVPVGDNDKADLTKLPEVTQRYNDALKKRQDAIQKTITTGKNYDSAWENGFKSAPKDLVDEYNKATDKLHEAYKKEGEMMLNNEKNPTEENALYVAAAKEDVAAWERIVKEAHQKIVDSFKPEDRKAYDAAKAAYVQANKEVAAAIEEERAASEALEKLKQALSNSLSK